MKRKYQIKFDVFTQKRLSVNNNKKSINKWEKVFKKQQKKSRKFDETKSKRLENKIKL